MQRGNSRTADITSYSFNRIRWTTLVCSRSLRGLEHVHVKEARNGRKCRWRWQEKDIVWVLSLSRDWLTECSCRFPNYIFIFLAPSTLSNTARFLRVYMLQSQHTNDIPLYDLSISFIVSSKISKITKGIRDPRTGSNLLRGRYVPLKLTSASSRATMIASDNGARRRYS